MRAAAARIASALEQANVGAHDVEVDVVDEGVGAELQRRVEEEGTAASARAPQGLRRAAASADLQTHAVTSPWPTPAHTRTTFPTSHARFFLLSLQIPSLSRGRSSIDSAITAS